MLRLLLTTLFACAISAQTYQLEDVGPGCDGAPTLDVLLEDRGTNGRITIQAFDIDPVAHDMMIMSFGVDLVGPVALPLGDCPMYSPFIWGLWVNYGVADNWSWSRAWPASVIGHYYIQLATYNADTGVITTSNCQKAMHQ